MIPQAEGEGSNIPYTSLKRLSVQAAAANPGTWGAGGTSGDDLNTGCFGPLDTILAGISTFSVGSSNISLTFTAGGGGDVNNCMWRFAGTLTASIVVSPAAGDATTYLNGFYYFENVTSGSFTITVTTGAGSVVLPQSRRGVLFIDAVNGPRIVAIAGSSSADPIPVGTVMFFFQASVPTGWTAYVPATEYMLRIVGNGSGGSIGGSVSFASVFDRTATDSHTLTTNEIPAHSHTVTSVFAAGDSFAAATASGNVALKSPTNFSTNNTGGGAGHTHGIDMRAFYLTTILGIKA